MIRFLEYLFVVGIVIKQDIGTRIASPIELCFVMVAVLRTPINRTV